MSAEDEAMFQFQGIWLPDGERHFPQWMAKHGEIVEGRGTYQVKKWRACLPLLKNRRLAVDAGAHVGLWSIPFATCFEQVHAFEPVAQFRECWARNVDAKNAILYPCALGARHGRVTMRIDPADSGGTHVARAHENGEVEMFTLDEFDLIDVDFLKIDCEGYEAEVVKGALATIERSRPLVIVEQKPHKLGPNFGIRGTPAVDLLRSLGYHLEREMGGDYIMAAA